MSQSPSILNTDATSVSEQRPKSNKALIIGLAIAVLFLFGVAILSAGGLVWYYSQSPTASTTQSPTSTSDPNASQSSESATSTSNQTTSDALQSEANALAQDVYGKMVIDCEGELYTIEKRGNFVQLWEWRDVDIGATRARLFETDPMNGVDYRGSIHFNVKFLHRFSLSTRQWEDWQGALGNPNWTGETINITKQRGEWKLLNSKMTTQYFLTNGSCDDVNRITSGLPVTSKNDLSDTYGIVRNVIFNKKTLVVFVTPEQFFNDSGKSSFDGLVYDRRSSLPAGLKFVDGRSLTPDDYRRLGQ
jgi:hypothetical protein